MLNIFKSSSPKASNDLWINLTDFSQLDGIASSPNRMQLLFKHSTRCSISLMAKNRLERELAQLAGKMDLYYLDLIRFRKISDEIAQRFGIIHESPQVIVIKDGKAIYDASHNGIDTETLLGLS